MSKDYVSKELARELQEKGYPLKKVYRQDEAPLFYDLPQDHPDWSQCDAWYLPVIWDVLKWLREKHAIHIEILLGRNGWYFEIIQYEYYEEEKEYDCKLKTISVIYDSYEETAIAGIEYVLDNLI